MLPVYWLVFTTVQGMCHMKREGKACETKGLQEEGMAEKVIGDSKSKHYSLAWTI